MTALYRSTSSLGSLATPHFARSIHASAALLLKVPATTYPDLPEPPKKPSGPYSSFFSEQVKKVKDEYRNSEGKVDVVALAKATGAAWNALSEDAKKPYSDAFKTAQASYNEKYHQYYTSLTPAQLSQINSLLPKPLAVPTGYTTIKGETKKGKRTSKLVTLEEGKRPLTAFFKFMHDFRNSSELEKMMEDEGVPKAEKAVFSAKQGGIKWAAMSDSEKQTYKDACAPAQQAYKEWKDSQTK